MSSRRQTTAAAFSVNRGQKQKNKNCGVSNKWIDISIHLPVRPSGAPRGAYSRSIRVWLILQKGITEGCKSPAGTGGAFCEGTI